MAACNPYRFRQNLERRQAAGLIFRHPQHNNPLVERDRLEQLVYVVYPLPETMKQLVWDFGNINQEDELMYIQGMLKKSELPDIFGYLI